MSPERLLFSHVVFNAFEKKSIILGVQNDDALREYFHAGLKPNIALLFTFFKFNLFFGNLFSVLIELFWLEHEHFLSLVVSARKAVQDIAAVSAIIFCQTKTQDLKEDLIW